ncbi:hypothetical protein AVEN_150562-1 [Araneus ventricosus]|uniref:Uncharacterized protein n=1 Tax=Araneus ventricosus TaxID=182803 RepID=A0A4Y2EJI0_ARAVE|nr:hypothetical protein AVEN_150562-1 [Araneus ventricosus]
MVHILRCYRHARKRPKIRSRGNLQRYNVEAPFERIEFDILGRFPGLSDDNRNILVMDYFTERPKDYPLPDQEAMTAAEALL